MPDYMTELEEAARTVRYPENCSNTDWYEFERLCSPDRILALVAVVKAAEGTLDDFDKWDRDVEAVIGRQVQRKCWPNLESLRNALKGIR